MLSALRLVLTGSSDAAQQAEHLLLDEPTNHLDVRYQHEILRLVGRLPVTTVVVLHDLNLAARYCDALVMLIGILQVEVASRWAWVAGPTHRRPSTRDRTTRCRHRQRLISQVLDPCWPVGEQGRPPQPIRHDADHQDRQ
jgi:ABC-type glutathione transport system ATPase component